MVKITYKTRYDICLFVGIYSIAFGVLFGVCVNYWFFLTLVATRGIV